jgi:hypothetical protein
MERWDRRVAGALFERGSLGRTWDCTAGDSKRIPGWTPSPSPFRQQKGGLLTVQFGPTPFSLAHTSGYGVRHGFKINSGPGRQTVVYATMAVLPNEPDSCEHVHLMYVPNEHPLDSA